MAVRGPIAHGPVFLMRIGHQLGLLVGACTVGGLAVASLLWRLAEDLEGKGGAVLEGEVVLRDHTRLQALGGHFPTPADMVMSSGNAYLQLGAEGQADALKEPIQDLGRTEVGSRFSTLLSDLPS